MDDVVNTSRQLDPVSMLRRPEEAGLYESISGTATGGGVREKEKV